MNRIAFAVFSALLAMLLGGAAMAANRLFIPDLSFPQGAPGRKIAIHCEHDFTISAFSFSLRYDPRALEVVGITTAGTSAEGRDFFEGTHDPVRGEIAYGAVLDQFLPFDRFLPPAQDHTLAMLTVNVLAPGGTATAIEFADGLGEFFPIANVLTDTSGESVLPGLVSGRITVGAAAPIADAGPDRLAAELAAITLDGSASLAAGSGALIYQWRQIFGPPAESISGVNAARWTLKLPPVADDTPLVFELEVRENDLKAVDVVTVTAVDADLRKALLEFPAPGAAVLLPGGARAVLFTGEIRWQTRLEDGLWSGLRFTASGAGDESALLGAAALYLDANRSGQWEESDEELGRIAPIPADDAAIEFHFAKVLKEGEARRFFLVADRAAGGTGGVARARASGLFFLIALLAVLALSPNPLRERMARPGRRALQLAGCLALFLAYAPVACKGGGGGGGGAGAKPPTGPAVQREVRFGIAAPGDVFLKGATTGVEGTAVGVPIEGPGFEFHQ